MSEQQKPGCCGPLFGLWLIAMTFSLIIYAFADNSEDVVEDLDFDEISFMLFHRYDGGYDIDSHKIKHEKNIEDLEVKGIDPSEELIDRLEDLDQVSNITLSTQEDPAGTSRIENVGLKFRLDMGGGESALVSMFFLVNSKSFTKVAFSEFKGLYHIKFEFRNQAHSAQEPTDLLNMLYMFYDDKVLEQFISKMKKMR